jgi:Fur family ferric uptake transcriptional regulator
LARADGVGEASMTSPHTGPAVVAPDVAAAVAALRERGLRISSARRLVLEGLYLADEPVAAERIASGLDGRVPPSDLATVYRNLETLESLGLVRHFHLGHGPGLYAPAGDEREYLLCEACDRLQVVDPAQLDGVRELIESQFGFRARFTHFPIVGVCPDCASGPESS